MVSFRIPYDSIIICRLTHKTINRIGLTEPSHILGGKNKIKTTGHADGLRVIHLATRSRRNP